MRLDDWLEKNTPPQVLYHYTSAAGLEGILKEKSVRATALYFLSDCKEYRHAIEIVSNLILKRQVSTEDRYLIQFYSEFVRFLESTEAVNLCAFSLTEHGDLLSQWRGYCPMGGYSIGFAKDQIRTHLERQGFFLAHCVYDQPTQCELVNPLLNEVVEQCGKLQTTRVFHELCALVTDGFLGEFWRIAPLIKHSSFSEESEWRAISRKWIPRIEQKCWIRGAVPVPYYPLSLCDDNHHFQIERIIVGPMANQDLALLGVGVLLKNYNVEHCDIDRSEVPYRPL